MLLRRFNNEGIDRFRTFIGRLKTEDKSLPAPMELLEDDTLTEVIGSGIDCPDAKFANRLAAAEYLDKLLEPVGLADAFADVGLWSWLALRFFDQLCRRATDGTRSPGEETRWIPLVDANRRYYRHLLLGPIVVYRAHRDDPRRAAALLADPPHIATAEVYRLFIENPALTRSKSAVAAATSLYYDSTRKKIRRGAGSKEAGDCRRLIAVMQQFDCTFDLFALTERTLLNMLPKEFDPFQPAPLIRVANS